MSKLFLETPPGAISGMSGAYCLLSTNMKTGSIDTACEGVRQRLTQALNIVHFLDKGYSITKLLPVVQDVQAISIGHMISALYVREIVSREDYAPFDLLQVIADNLQPYKNAAHKSKNRNSDEIVESIIPEGDPGPTRCMVIEALFRGGILQRNVSLRQIRPVGSTPLISDVAKLIEERTNLSFKGDICSRQRASAIIKARFKTIWIMRRVCGFSLTMIGNSLGGRDHTTILNGLNKMMIDRDTDAGTRTETDLLCEKADLIGVMNGFERHRTIEENRPAARLSGAPDARI